MSPAEMIARAQQSLRDLADRYRTHRAPRRAGGCVPCLKPWRAPELDETVAYLHAADEVMSGRVDLFGSRHELGIGPIDWNRDPITGVRAPMTHGKFLDYRDRTLVGSARNTWELNRHMQLVTLAQAYAISGHEKYAVAVVDLSQSWMRQCPYPLGINWASALESGIRLINWYMAARLLGGRKAGDQFDSEWLDSIYWHCRFIWRNQSRFSSANNHLIGEMAGLYVASTVWPGWTESHEWRAVSKSILEAEVVRQVHADGVLREQSSGYTLFVLQFLLMAGLVGELEGDPYSAEFWANFRRLLAGLASVSDAAGHLPDFGDSDDGMVFQLSPAGRAGTLSEFLEVDAAFAGLDVMPSPCGSLQSWLEQGFPRPSAYPRGGLARRNKFPEGGYYVLSNRVGTPTEELIVFDAGPLGFLSIAAHGHADCLSFVMSLGGRQVLIDPGTYCYHENKAWRDYFRSTAAHNTLRVDGHDQSVMGGAFMWLKKASPCVEAFSHTNQVQMVTASHDGFTRLADGVIHRRRLELLANTSSAIVTDELECRGAHRTERFWHFAEALSVTCSEVGTVIAECSSFKLELSAGAESSIELCTGSLEPRAGWVSRKFGVLTPTTTAIVSASISGTTSLRTLLRWSWKQPHEPR